GVEGGHELLVGDDLGRREDAVAGDRGLVHVSLSRLLAVRWPETREASRDGPFPIDCAPKGHEA
ncbi:MAG: hypothetical protein ACOCTP_00835, partial [Roseicyclus sp.]